MPPKGTPQIPEAVVKAGLPEGTPATVSLPDDAWDMLGLGTPDGLSEKSLQIKNGQVVLLTAGDWFSSRSNMELEQKEAYRQQWQYEAEARLARIEAKKNPLERSGEGFTQGKFAWSKDGQKAFEWRKIYHALCPGVGQMPDGGLLTETPITPTAMRMYTDHRVMGAVVLPGVSHVSLMAATGSIGMPSPGGISGDWHMSVKETLFERPYIVNSGAELIAAIASGVDPATIGASMAGGLQAAVLPLGVPLTYCRATNVSKERGQIKPTLEWAK